MTAEYAELVCRSNFSFLAGASHPEELVDQAVGRGLRALAITDQDGLYGVVKAHVRLRELERLGLGSLRLIVGARVTVDGMPPLVLLARDRQGYGNLCALLTRGRRRCVKGDSRVTAEELAEHTQGLSALLLDAQPADSGGDDPIRLCLELFGPELSLALTRHLLPGQEERLRRLARRGEELGVPLVAVGDVLYHHRSRQPLQDVLTCTRWGCTLEQAGLRLRPNAERHLRGPRAMARLFRERPGAVRRSLEIAERCTFSLDELRYRYPSELLPEDQRDAMSYLRHLVRQGERWRYPEGTPPTVQAQLDHELELIAKLDFPHYFLTVHDMIRFARERDILCQGRGSAANSAVCYVLGITAVDPARSSLLFERFISEERGEPPDIDIDCEHERREEIIQYLYERFGRHRAAMVSAVVTYRGRSAVREVGKALGYPEEVIDRLAKGMIHGAAGTSETLPALFAEAGLDPTRPQVRIYGALTRQLLGFPRHLTIHSGGFVLSDERLDRLVPIENAAMEGRTVIQWDKDDLEALGLLKVDVLALGMLTCIHKCFDLVERHQGRRLTLATLPAGDRAVYDMICQADTVGVFQIESRAQMSMLPRLRPRCYYDLVVEVAIVRPGPIQGKMVHPYLRRRGGEEPVVYPHPALREILGRTYGVPLFQEQVMRLAVAVAGFTPGEADELRRAMGSWRRTGRMHELAQKLLDGMRANGLSEEFAQKILKQIKGFAEYGFPESHAASFALLVYASAYLKRHHPAPFVCALLNSLPMGFYHPRTLVADAQRHGVAVRPADVHHSHWDSTLERYTDGHSRRRLALRLGFRLIKGMKQAAAEAIVACRERDGAFTDLSALQRRARLDRGVLERLAEADALQSVLAADRRRVLWAVRGLPPTPDDLFEGHEPADLDAPLPQATAMDEVLADYQSLGLSLRAHPLKLMRRVLDRRGVSRAADLLERADGRQVTVAGLVVTRQRPGTASGVVFLSLEDETGLSNVVVWPAVFERYRREAARAHLLLIRGRLQRAGLVANVIASLLEPLTLPRELRAPSRNFH